MKNRNKIIIPALLAASTIISPANSLKAQDTLVKHDTVKVQQIEKVVYDTVRVADRDHRKDYPLRVVELGVRFMPTVTSLELNKYNGEIVQGTASLSYGYGFMLAINFSKNIGIQGEVNYNAISQKYKDRNLDRELHINYINIPVLLSINTNKTKPVNLNIVAGPQFGVNVGSNMNTVSSPNTDTLHAVLAVKQGDIGFAYGAGLEFALNRSHTLRFDIGFRGVYGLVNIDDSVSDNNTYNILIHASRKSYAGYAGLTFLF